MTSSGVRRLLPTRMSASWLVSFTEVAWPLYSDQPSVSRFDLDNLRDTSNTNRETPRGPWTLNPSSQGWRGAMEGELR